MSYSKITAFGKDLIDETDALSARAKLGSTSVGVHRASTNVCVALGDSITAIGALPVIGDMYMSQICMKTKQKVQFGGTFALGGTHLQVLRDTYLPQVLAMSPLPGACIIFGGTNDTANTGGTWSLSGRAAILKDIVAGLVNNGILPILVAIPPHTDNTSFNPRVIAWNTWLRRYGSRNGYPLIDAYTACADATGNYISGYSDDGLHPTKKGHSAIADRAIADGIADAFPPQGRILTRRSTADTTNLFNDGSVNLGMFTVDTNADGIANGLSLIPGGPSTQSLVTPAGGDDLLGKWQQIARTTGNTGDMFMFCSIGSGWSAGDVIAFSARIQTEAMLTSNTAWSVALQTDLGEAGCSGWNSDLADGLLYVEVTLPVANSLVWFKMAVAAVGGTGSPKLRAGEVSVVNLTTGGLLV